MDIKNIQIGIVGMGPSGCIAAIRAASLGASVTIFDKNEKIGKKIYITGKGRCNVTNATPYPDFFNGLCHNPKFLYSAFSNFSNIDVMNFFENSGVPLKIERGNRVFPVSDHASDINKALENRMINSGVKILKNSNIDNIYFDKKINKFIFTTDNKNYDFDRIIIATGGLSYPTTGSTGDGYSYARKFGHKINECTPSLVSIKLTDDWIKSVEGLSLKNVSLSIKINKKEYSEFGEMLFTSDGISGPIILTQSANISGKIQSSDDVTIKLDWKPALTAQDLNHRFLKERNESPNQMIKTLLEKMFPKKFVPVFIAHLNIDCDKPLNSMRKSEEIEIINLMKNFPLQFKSLGDFNEAVVTRGGVNIKEINPSTMESKLKDGLFFAGEVLDIDAYTGGYNLQIAFSTGYLAGESAATVS